MKNKKYLLSISFALLLLSAIVLYSAHGINHLIKFDSEICHKKHSSDSKTEISHGHHDVEHCFACEFTFSSSINSKIVTFQFNKIEIVTPYTTSYSKEITQNFKGSLFSLRAPPPFIV